MIFFFRQKQFKNLYFLKKLDLLIVVILYFNLGLGFADPPFISDSPEPVDYQHWEIYFFSNTNISNSTTQLQFPDGTFDWSPVNNLQLSLTTGLLANLPSSGTNSYGFGDTNTSVLYRFLQESKYIPQSAIEPQINWPTGNHQNGLGNGKAWIQVPIWLEKNWNKWRTYGGGGYALNSQTAMKNFPYGGWVLQRNITDQFQVGGEIYSQAAQTDTSKSYTLFNLGAMENFNAHFSLLFSIGHSITGQKTFISYLSLYWIS